MKDRAKRPLRLATSDRILRKVGYVIEIVPMALREEYRYDWRCGGVHRSTGMVCRARAVRMSESTNWSPIGLYCRRCWSDLAREVRDEGKQR